MVQKRNLQSETAREEDYRDYDKRNLGDGWPYADQDKLPAGRNAPYGSTASNFDETDNVGAEIAGATAIHSQGGPAASPATEEQVIEDDGLEERINDVLSADDRIDEELVTVTVHNAVATLSGHVETDAIRVLAETLTLSVKGVKDCVNQLVLIGSDSHIPADSDI